jgi:hypothetical protein
MTSASALKPEFAPLTPQQRKQIIERSTVLIDSLSDIAVEIVVDFIGKTDCATANTILLRQPEILAVKALEQASKRLLQSRQRPAGASLH